MIIATMGHMGVRFHVARDTEQALEIAACEGDCEWQQVPVKDIPDVLVSLSKVMQDTV